MECGRSRTLLFWKLHLLVDTLIWVMIEKALKKVEKMLLRNGANWPSDTFTLAVYSSNGVLTSNLCDCLSSWKSLIILEVSFLSFFVAFVTILSHFSTLFDVPFCHFWLKVKIRVTNPGQAKDWLGSSVKFWPLLFQVTIPRWSTLTTSSFFVWLYSGPSRSHKSNNGDVLYHSHVNLSWCTMFKNHKKGRIKNAKNDQFGEVLTI